MQGNKGQRVVLWGMTTVQETKQDVLVIQFSHRPMEAGCANPYFRDSEL
jgi:hypothetical protein